ncbi:MAG: hypothetical protein NWE81_01260 [Candidatus Bathyarchaeota archaeon]|nr:hypothetical protein [Candidatus Bathyarchaeota archaeon]
MKENSVSRIRWIIKKFELDTQTIRARLVTNLEALMQQAMDHAKASTKEKKKKTKHLREWSRLAAYISQTINSVLREYDEKEIKGRLTEIEQRLEALTQKREMKDELEKQDQNIGEETSSC